MDGLRADTWNKVCGEHRFLSFNIYAPIRHNIMTTCLILCWSRWVRAVLVAKGVAAKTALTHQGMDSSRPLEVCFGIWHQDVSSRFFKSSKLQGGASVDQTCLSSTSHRSSIRLRSGEFGGQVNTSNLSCFSNHSWTTVALRQGALSCWKRPQPSGNTISMKGCSWSATMLR